MSLLLSALTRFASCVILFAVILYAPALVHAFMLPKWAWHARSDSGVARRQPANVACPRRLAEAEAEVIAVRYGGPRRTPKRAEPAACRLAAAWRA
jgi:hypothetical protein